MALLCANFLAKKPRFKNAGLCVVILFARIVPIKELTIIP
jgi:hypothetical protein